MGKINALLSAILLTACLCGAAPRPAKIPIILDTDIGGDIDDAFALALAMDSPEIELLGVTTVSGDTTARARLAAKFLWEAGGKWRKVPVAAGVPGRPLPVTQTHWADGFTSPQIQKESAVDFMRSKINRNPGQITLIAIGELTNVAALLKADPQVAKKIKRIALMGGSIAYSSKPGVPPAPEWNIKSNPAAAQVVFSSGVPIVMAPLDVTVMLKLDAAGRSRIFNQKTPLSNNLEALYHLWSDAWKHETPTLFDPMAVAMVLDPALCQTKDLAVEVDERGVTRIVEGKPANATVGISTDPAQFFEFYLDRVARK